MKYKPGWKGHLRINYQGTVFWDGQERGRVVARFVDGAKSPGGMVTNTVYSVGGLEYPSMTRAVEALVPQPEMAVAQ